MMEIVGMMEIAGMMEICGNDVWVAGLLGCWVALDIQAI